MRDRVVVTLELRVAVLRSLRQKVLELVLGAALQLRCQPGVAHRAAQARIAVQNHQRRRFDERSRETWNGRPD